MRTLALASLLMLAAVAWSPVASAQDGSRGSPIYPPLEESLARLRDGAFADRKTDVKVVLDQRPSVADIRAAVARIAPPEAKAGWQVLDAVDENGVARPYHLYVPELAVEPEEDGRPPLLVDMHGGVSRPEFITREQFGMYRNTWTELADEYGFVVAMPLGRRDCTWWSDAGVAHVRATIRDVRRRVDSDPDRITATGFSDGGSGCFYLAMAAPDPFAALMPMNGHPMVAVSASQRQLYLRNAAAMPLFVCMTQDDGLYPAQTVLPHVLALIQQGAQVHLVSYPTGGHTPSYFEDQGEAFASFLMQRVRDPLPDQLEWATAHKEIGRAHWIEVIKIAEAERDAPPEAVKDVQVMSSPGRVRIGIGIDREYPGPGVKVTTVDDRRPAGALGLKVGDILTRVDETRIENLASLREVLGTKRFGDTIDVEIVRHGTVATAEPILSSTVIPAFTPEPSYKRERPTAWFEAARLGNVVRITSRGIRTMRLHLSPTEFDLDQKVKVIVNGIERVLVDVNIDVEMMVDGWAREADPSRLFAATVDVTIPPPDSSK